jgi:hypothetical protein
VQAVEGRSVQESLQAVEGRSVQESLQAVEGRSVQESLQAVEGRGLIVQESLQAVEGRSCAPWLGILQAVQGRSVEGSSYELPLYMFQQAAEGSKVCNFFQHWSILVIFA